MFPCCSSAQSEYGMLTRTVGTHASYSNVGRRASNVNLVEQMLDILLQGRLVESDARIQGHFKFGHRRRHGDTMSTHNTSTF